MPKLSDKSIRALPTPDRGRRLYFDSHREAPKGFGVRVTAAGSRAFVLRYSAAGKDRLMTIGEYPTWSVAAARKQASELRREIDSGTDILEQRREERGEPTIKTLVPGFLETKRSLASHSDIEAALRLHVLPVIGNRKIRDVRRRDVIALVGALAERHPRQAALVLTYLKQLMGYAEDREIIEASPIATLRPERIGAPLRQRPRDRVLSDAEIAALWTLAAPAAGMHRATLIALKLILLTGQRPGEVCGMRWEEITGDVWTIPSSRRGKTNTAHSVPLTGTALDLLEAARGFGGEACVLEAWSGKPIGRAALSKAALRCTEALGMADARWRPHDLRRTMRTGLAAAGVPDAVAEAVIGHTRKGIAAVYDLHRYDREKRAALEAWERRLLSIAEGREPENNVVTFR